MIPPIKRRYGFLNELHDRLGRVSDSEKLLAYFLRRALNFFDADSGAIWLHDRASDRFQREVQIGARDAFDESQIRLAFENKRHEVPTGTILAPLLEERRTRGIVALRRKGNPFQLGEGRFLGKI